jgi:hypothetical protein
MAINNPNSDLKVLTRSTFLRQIKKPREHHHAVKLSGTSVSGFTLIVRLRRSSRSQDREEASPKTTIKIAGFGGMSDEIAAADYADLIRAIRAIRG